MDSFQNYEQKQSDYAILRPFLNGEAVLWMGHPSRRDSRPYGTVIYPRIFSIFWLSFAIFWTVTATSAAGFFGLFGLPFIGFGCFFVYSVFCGYKKLARNTYYAVTPRRALIVTVRRRGTDCTEHLFFNLPGIQLSEVKGTCGTISFAPYQSPLNRRYSRRGTTDLDAFSGGDWTTSFRSVEDVQRVYQLISEQITACNSNN